MSALSGIYHEVFYRPLLNALVFLTAILPYHDLGFAVILLTLLVRGALFPFTHHSIKAQVKMRELEPHINKIKEEFKDKQEEQARRIMALYKEHGVDPFSGCLVLLIQLPILIGLYQVFWKGLGTDTFTGLYSFITQPEALHVMFLGILDLSQRSIVMAVLAAVTQFIQIKLSVPKTPKTNTAPRQPDMARVMNAQMMYMMPGLIFVAGLQFPAAVGLYWTTMNLFAIIHETFVRSRAQKVTTTTTA
ncbi:MAG: hypothetical protein A3C84_01625 [Candidatus Ryanbacteria bacterium RIFCSPHIGHO2_02_FULL_48_12]|uniref:Membrane insertase YidC/Oxa/ALB C-terminal domain-containing protein n=1 Tax=Candidatus Ryanbacteria bacterium RIFCSPHIGHO2_01_FULL_48_27 TaxID=1802115 RepID=A0A1G2G8J8_9BACT|nr:MAG: hypothetical protein A2756_06360 [Candidatus Ryanbacteria bacterium RIFCSPHIGHO2_01_FULL_48_27]OGZ49181.1 MAG: hypothetical protein A3C84_01625 [Candidatus Ryanbacteria bacterium RIFCSPHIGHO2_02_FULL_48_12]